jgi:FKBP-type peptidyl-prolyl cis-trans isomerase FkpA
MKFARCVVRPFPALALAFAASLAAAPEQAPGDAPAQAPAAALPAAPAAANAAYPLSAFSAIGSSFAQGNHLPELGWDEAQISAFIDGIRAAFHGKAYPFDDAAKQVSAEMGRRIGEIEARERQQAFAQPGQLSRYLKDISKRLGLEQTDSGLCYAIQSAGKGNRPGPNDVVIMSCTAVAADGSTKLPQLSTQHVRIKVSDLLPGIAEGIQLMTNTSQAIFVVPPALSYGQGEWPQGVDRGAPIIFQVTLHQVVGAGAPP